MCQWPWETKRWKILLQMWKVNVLNTSRSEWISQGEHYSKVKIVFFIPVMKCWPEEQKHVCQNLVKVFSMTFFFHLRCLNLWLPETTSQRECCWTNHELISGLVSVTPSVRHPPFPGSVCVWTDVEDVVDLCDLTSHQVEQSFAKHDLKCAGPRANAAVTLAGPSCQLSE